MRKLEKIYFTEEELGSELYEAYINMSPVFYKSAANEYYWAECWKSEAQKLGTLDDVKAFIKEIAS